MGEGCCARRRNYLMFIAFLHWRCVMWGAYLGAYLGIPYGNLWDSVFQCLWGMKNVFTLSWWCPWLWLSVKSFLVCYGCLGIESLIHALGSCFSVVHRGWWVWLSICLDWNRADQLVSAASTLEDWHHLGPAVVLQVMKEKNASKGTSVHNSGTSPKNIHSKFQCEFDIFHQP